MARWLVADSLACPEQFFCSHLDSYSHYLREAGEDVDTLCLNLPAVPGVTYRDGGFRTPDVMFALDRYDMIASLASGLGMRSEPRTPIKSIAQVAAICNPMPWDVRKLDGSPAYDLVISSIPAMVDEARAKGCRAKYMPLAFDARARVCGMGVKRDINCLFIGSTGGNHVRRTQLLEELKDVVTVMPPAFGREYMKTLARARCVISPHAEWSGGHANNMRLFEAAGLGCEVVSDGNPNPLTTSPWWWTPESNSVAGWRNAIHNALEIGAGMVGDVLELHAYECADRVPRLIELARSL